MANLVRAISQNGGIVVCALDSTAIVREAERIHKPSAVVTAALGRLLTAASLMGSRLKNTEDSLTLRVNGGGPAGTLVAVSDGEGNVRGYADHAVIQEPPYRPDGKLDVGAAVGREGTLAVLRDMGFGEPYIGQVPLVSGEIAEDITSYYASSEQTPTVCSLGVLVNRDLSVRRAGGFLLQLLPGATEAEIAKIEANIAGIPSVTTLLEEGKSPYDMANMALAGFFPEVLEEREVEHRCHCSRAKTEAILMSLGRQELEKMALEDPIARVECHFCGKIYEVKIAALLGEI